MDALEWERMGRELRERAERWEHPAAEPETGADIAALDELAEVFRAAMSGFTGRCRSFPCPGWILHRLTEICTVGIQRDEPTWRWC